MNDHKLKKRFFGDGRVSLEEPSPRVGALKLAYETRMSDTRPSISNSSSHGRTLVCAHKSAASSSGSGRPGTNRETTSRFLPPLLSSQLFPLRHAATSLIKMKLAASYLLGRPNWHRPDLGLCIWCEEEIETTEHASTPLPHPSIRQRVLSRDPGP